MNNYTNLENKVAVVTGAGRGTGKAIAMRLAKAGIKLVLSDLNLGSIKQCVMRTCGRGKPGGPGQL